MILTKFTYLQKTNRYRHNEDKNSGYQNPKIVKVFPSQTCHLSTQVSGTQRLILSSIQDQPVRFSLPQSQRFFLNWDAAGF
jgi:hypothetical protein